MRQSLDFGRFRSRKDADLTQSESAPTRARSSTIEDVPKLQRRRSVQDFFKTNVASFGRRVGRRGKRNPRPIDSDSRRTSRVLELPLSLEKETLMRSDDDGNSSDETIRQTSPGAAHQELGPLSAHPPLRTPSIRKMTTLAEEGQLNPLAENDLQALFLGAPEFRISTLHASQTPQVTYHDLDLDHIQDACDHAAMSHKTFSATTTRLDARLSSQNRQPLAYEASEVPNMEGENGVEPGTVGYDYFLELATADANLVEDEHDNTPNRRILFRHPEKLGLRPVAVEVMIDRLLEISDNRHQDQESDAKLIGVNDQRATEMHAELFEKILMPPKYSDSSEDDSTGAVAQIEALVRTLSTPDLWYDFSFLEQRIRLGQLLWAATGDSDLEEVVSERDVVLLQITLASELLIRLEALGETIESIKGPADDADLAMLLTRKTSWDIVLARRFLDNVRVAAGKPSPDTKPNKQNRNSLFSLLSFVTAKETLEEEGPIEPIFYPRHESRQLDGLRRFAELLGWPHADDISKKLEAGVKEATALTFGAYATVVTPASSSQNRDNYFGFARPQLGRSKTAQSIQLLPPSAYDAESFEAGGWLSRSWLTGLVLPGESASHFLISTLLENSPQALESLGESANLYGGFRYQDKSYWSKSCIVGRVLAAATESKNCMGWVSVPDTGTGHRDEWISVESKQLRYPSEPRINRAGTVSQDSAAYPRILAGRLTAEDFTWPHDNSLVRGNEVHYHGLAFSSSGTTYELSRQESVSIKNGIAATPTSTATLSFSSTSGSQLPRLEIPLTYDVYFVPSYPCFPQNKRPESVHLPSTPSSRMRTSDSAREEKALPVPPCHPLHKSYSYDIVPVAALISGNNAIAEFAAASVAARTHDNGYEEMDSTHDNRTECPKTVLVLDCRGQSSDSQVLARAWCAEIGQNAIIGRSGRTCLACCVREAMGLGMRVVIRV